MANAASSKETTPTRPGPGNRRTGRAPSLSGMGDYFRGVIEELRKAHWPTRAEMIRLTQIVLMVIFIVAVYVGAMDAVLSWITERFIFRSRP